jgi:hypothetical protein
MTKQSNARHQHDDDVGAPADTIELTDTEADELERELVRDVTTSHAPARRTGVQRGLKRVCSTIGSPRALATGHRCKDGDNGSFGDHPGGG